MARKVMITCAVTGAIHTPSMSPYLPITASEIDVDYDGRQSITAAYGMVEFPLADWAKFVGGARVESTDIRIVNTPESQALWVPPGQFGVATLLP